MSTEQGSKALSNALASALDYFESEARRLWDLAQEADDDGDHIGFARYYRIRGDAFYDAAKFVRQSITDSPAIRSGRRVSDYEAAVMLQRDLFAEALRGYEEIERAIRNGDLDDAEGLAAYRAHTASLERFQVPASARLDEHE